MPISSPHSRNEPRFRATAADRAAGAVIRLRTPLTLRSAIDDTATALTPTSPTSRLDAEVLVRHVSGASHTDLVTRADRPLSEKMFAELAQLVERRRQGEPIAYLTGSREFWSLELAVTPATLIPRPETELLVERALAHLPASADGTIADLGTGCGAIALALAHERPRLRVLATDRSEAALAVARANAKRLGIVNVEFRAGDWLAPLGDLRLSLLVANPPYLRADDPHLAQGDVRFEPRAALVAGTDGLADIRRIVADARAPLAPGGWLLLEHGFDQASRVRALLAEHGYGGVASYRDLAGYERVTQARAV